MKRKKKIIFVVVTMMLMLVTASTAFGEQGSFYLQPLRNGSSVYSPALKKEDTYTAVANVTPQRYSSFQGYVYMRVRTSTGTAAGNVVDISSHGKQYLPYWAGYNTVGSYKRLYCNYVSDDTYYGGLIIEGIWEP